MNRLRVGDASEAKLFSRRRIEFWNAKRRGEGMSRTTYKAHSINGLIASAPAYLFQDGRERPNSAAYAECVHCRYDLPLISISMITTMVLIAGCEDFCLIPIGTPSASVSKEVAEVQRLLKKSDVKYTMHSAGTVRAFNLLS